MGSRAGKAAEGGGGHFALLVDLALNEVRVGGVSHGGCGRGVRARKNKGISSRHDLG